ncbi:MAG: hypothetical protein R2939_00640 [Kofleriaceae bacterium]
MASLLGCGGGGGGTAPTTPVGQGGPRLCVEVATAHGAVVAIEEGAGADDDGAQAALEALPQDVFTGLEDIGARILDGDDLVVAVVDLACEASEEGTCAARLMRLSPAGADAKVTAQAELPDAAGPATMGSSPVVIQAVWPRGEELWVSYGVTGQPEPTVGATTDNRVAIFDRRTLALRGALTYARWPEASILEGCISELEEVDLDCDGQVDLVQHQRCQTAACLPDDDGGDDEPADPDDSGLACEPPTLTHRAWLRGAAGYQPLGS